MDFQEIRYEVDGPVLTITLNRPERLNAYTGTMHDEMMQAFDLADADDAVRAIVVTGEGRGFCAGADLERGGKTFDWRDRQARGQMAQDSGDEVPRDGGGMLTLRIFESKKFVIAAINGPAVGVGITMTLPMDVRMAADTAKMGFVFARRGIVTEACSSWFLPRVAGISQAMEWVGTGRVFGAEEALAGGLVRSIHPPDELLPAATGAGGRDRREHRPGVGRALAAAAVEHAGRRPPDGGAPGGLPRDVRPGPVRGRAGGHLLVPREARPELPRPGQRRSPGRVSRARGAGLPLSYPRARSRTIDMAQSSNDPSEGR